MNHWVEISEVRLARNYRRLVEAAGATAEILAVVKANAYGHGAEVCSIALVGAGARWLGVTCADEGVRVRRALDAAGLDAEIMVMSGSLPQDTEAIREGRLTPVVWTGAQAEWLKHNVGTKVHVEVDTGMGRQGVRVSELAGLMPQIQEAGLVVDGVSTHFCSTEVAGSLLTQRQERLFEEAIGKVGALGLTPEWVHAGNSSTIDNPAQEGPWLRELARSVGARAMVRTGLALYGYCLAIEGDAPSQVRAGLRPVMTWKTKVLAVRELAQGETVGYNATFTAEKDMRVALIPVGYADGLRRELSGKGWMMIDGQRAGILGRISMNLTVVDVTELNAVNAGDEVVVLGDGITAEDHARMAGTIAYEILCGVRSAAKART